MNSRSFCPPIIIWVFVIITLHCTLATAKVKGSCVEKNLERNSATKNEVKTFGVANPASTLSIQTIYGNIKINHWAKDSVQVSTTVTVESKTVALANENLAAVKIVSIQKGPYIDFTTETSGIKDKAKLHIDFEIYIPENLKLDINDSFGSIFLPEFSAPLNLKANVCKVYADAILNTNSFLDLRLGSVTINGVLNGTINAIGGNLNFKHVENLKGKFVKGDVIIDSLKNQGEFDIHFCKQFRINNLPNSFVGLKLNSKMSSVYIKGGKNPIKITSKSSKIHNNDTKLVEGNVSTSFYDEYITRGSSEPYKIAMNSQYDQIYLTSDQF